MSLAIEGIRKGWGKIRQNLGTLFPSTPRYTPIEPAQGGEKDTLQADCQKLLDKEDFGRNDFNDFIAKTIHLIGGERFKDGGLHSSGKLRDDVSKVSFGLNAGKWGTIVEVRGDPIAIEPGHHMEMRYEGLTYDATMPQPRLNVSVDIKMPKAYTFDSYVVGGDYPFFPNGIHNRQLNLPTNDQEVQRFCRRVFTVYQQSIPAIQT